MTTETLKAAEPSPQEREKQENRFRKRGESFGVLLAVGSAWFAFIACLAVILMSVRDSRIISVFSDHVLLLVTILGLLAGLSAVFSLLGVWARHDSRRVSLEIEEMARESKLRFLPEEYKSEGRQLARAVNTVLSKILERDHTATEKLAENRILRSRIRSLFTQIDTIQHGLVILDPANHVTFANHATSPYLHLDVSEASGKPLEDVIAPKGVLDFIKTASAAEKGHGLQRMVFTHGESDSECTAVIFHPVEDKDGNNVGSLLLFEDMTLLKQQEKARENFIDSVAHEIRTPLNTILSYAGMMVQSDVSDPEQIRNLCNVIFQEGHRLSSLIDGLLDISQMETGSMRLDISPTRIRNLIDDALEVVSGQAEEKKINLLVELPDRLPVIDVDKRLFTMAVTNIMSNAVKYTPEHGTVTVGFQSEQTHLLLQVSDTGFGISDEELPKIFEKFYRSDDADVLDQSGSGIGLSTAREVMRQHDGDILATSVKGEGSCFTISIPRTLVNQSLGD
jgi:signal transduction histidine kinase